MSQDNVMQLESVTEKLRDLKKYLPDKHWSYYPFGNFLADMFDIRAKQNENGKNITPFDFVDASILAVLDLERGRNGYIREEINNELTDLSGTIYFSLNLAIPSISKAIFPEDFAVEVEGIYKCI